MSSPPKLFPKPCVFQRESWSDPLLRLRIGLNFSQNHLKALYPTNYKFEARAGMIARFGVMWIGIDCSLPDSGSYRYI